MPFLVFCEILDGLLEMWNKLVSLMADFESFRATSIPFEHIWSSEGFVFGVNK